MYVNEDYDDYTYLVSASDNYVILTNRSSVNASWDNPKSIPVIYQYLNPSFITIESSRSYTNTTYFNEIETSQSFYSRADSLDIIKVQVIIIFMLLFFFNGLTRFVKKGGAIFGT